MKATTLERCVNPDNGAHNTTSSTLSAFCTNGNLLQHYPTQVHDCTVTSFVSGHDHCRICCRQTPPFQHILPIPSWNTTSVSRDNTCSLGAWVPRALPFVSESSSMDGRQDRTHARCAHHLVGFPVMRPAKSALQHHQHNLRNYCSHNHHPAATTYYWSRLCHPNFKVKNVVAPKDSCSPAPSSRPLSR